MNLKAAKELLHIKAWLDRANEIVDRGEDVYRADPMLQEAGDSLMMKLGEAAKRLAQLDVLTPEGVEWADAIANRNFLIHQYEEIDRNVTWDTLSTDILTWRTSLQSLFADADAVIDESSD